MSNKRLLFIPVSSPEGIGEYMRSLQLAQTLKAEYGEQLDIHFILNKHTAYAKDCPFPTLLLNQSATKESTHVCQFIKQYKPDAVLFDCAGRAEQMYAAKKRAKGLKLNRSGLIDTHWVVQPDYCFEPLSWYERLKLSMLSLAYPTNVGPFTVFASAQQKSDALTRYHLKEKEFFIVNAGSGGHTLNGQNCADIYYKAGLNIAKETGLKGVVVFGPNYTKSLPKNDELICLPSQEGIEFLALLSQAKVVLLCAGDTLLQAIALRTIACAISKDQNERIVRCASTSVVKEAKLDILDITQKIKELLWEPNYNNTVGLYESLENVHSFDVITKGVQALLIGSKP